MRTAACKILDIRTVSRLRARANIEQSRLPLGLRRLSDRSILVALDRSPDRSGARKRRTQLLLTFNSTAELSRMTDVPLSRTCDMQREEAACRRPSDSSTAPAARLLSTG